MRSIELDTDMFQYIFISNLNLKKPHVVPFVEREDIYLFRFLALGQ